jgi:hypothetical protein
MRAGFLPEDWFAQLMHAVQEGSRVLRLIWASYASLADATY